MGLVSGFQSIRSTIFSPIKFAAGVGAQRGEGSAVLGGDTDGDGLPDSVELQLGSSAFLVDTDSDGVTDSQEVAAGSDPTCAGATCVATPQGSTSAEQQTEVAAGDTSSINAASVTSDQLRQLLVEAGLDAQQVAGLTEEELAAAWQAALQQADTSQ